MTLYGVTAALRAHTLGKLFLCVCVCASCIIDPLQSSFGDHNRPQRHETTRNGSHFQLSRLLVL